MVAMMVAMMMVKVIMVLMKKFSNSISLRTVLHGGPRDGGEVNCDGGEDNCDGGDDAYP
jgi:hypothetical protein